VATDVPTQVVEKYRKINADEIVCGESYATVRGNALGKSARNLDYEASDAGRGAD